jgi:hypothetical protein
LSKTAYPLHTTLRFEGSDQSIETVTSPQSHFKTVYSEIFQTFL